LESIEFFLSELKFVSRFGVAHDEFSTFSL